MSAHEALGSAMQFMRTDMKGKLAGYMTSLEHRYGDPAVYAAQREQMMAEQAVVLHHQAKTREEALSLAYQKNRERIRDEHRSRIQQWVRDTPPRYLEVDQRPCDGPTAAR